MHTRSLRVALGAAFVLTALACGSSSTPSSTSTPATPAAEAPSEAAAPSGSSLSKWKVPDELESRLEAQGWKVGECWKDKSEGMIAAGCEATKGELVASVDWTQWVDAEEAGWMAETPNTVRDGKVTLSATVFDAGKARSLGEQVLPKGSAVTSLSTDMLENAAKQAGYSLESSDYGKEGEWVYTEVVGTRGEDLLLFEAEYTKGSTGGDEEREVSGGIYMVFQGDDDSFTVGVTDTNAATQLVQALAK